MARPTVMTEEKIELLEKICRLKPTLEDCATFLKVDSSTIEKWIRKNHDLSFSEFREQNMAHTRFMIVRNLLSLCEQKNLGALIWTSKNLLGWREKNEDIEKMSKSIEEVLKELKEGKNE